MNEPKVPDSDTDWRNVEIYVFCNGQHQSPPRKYHLDTEDLSSWSSTLMTMAHAQYGAIFSSVDLFTVDGERVYNPLQIRNGSAYVAVPPKDTFIPAGYTEYLLRATRSRERRQSKYLSNMQSERQDELESNLQATEIEAKEEIQNVEILNEDLNATGTLSFGEQTGAPPKVQSKVSTRSNNIVKSTNQNATILRKQNSMQPALSMARKTSIKIKENPIRKNLKLNPVKGANTGPTIITNTNNQIRTSNKSLTRTGKTTEKDTILKNANDRPKIVKKIESQVSIGKIVASAEKTVATENNVALENVIDDNELIVVKKQDSENRSYMFSELDKSGTILTTKQTRLSSAIPILTPIVEKTASESNKDRPVTVINNLIEKIYKPDTEVASELTSNSKSKVQMCDNVLRQEKSNINKDVTDINKETPLDNVIAVIDKGDIVNLNLKIEVRKCEGIVNVQDSKPVSYISEKGSQVNLAPEIILETIAKRSNLSNKLKVDEDNPKVVVIQCSCCENRNINEILNKIGSVKMDDKKYVIVLPEPQNDNNNERSQCTRDDSRGTDKSVPRVGTSLINPVKKVYATTSIQRLTTVKTTEDFGVTVSNTEYHETREPIVQTQTEFIEVSHNSSAIRKLYQSDSLILPKYKHSLKSRVDSSTQTEWCTMLVEAKQHEDGHYSFYLPPLNVLKDYGL